MNPEAKMEIPDGDGNVDHMEAIMSTWCRLLCSVIVAGAAISLPQDSHDWTVSQKMQALVLDKVQKQPYGVVFSLRNVSGKAITAIATSSPPVDRSRYSRHLDYLDGSCTMLVTGASLEWKCNLGALADGATEDWQIGQPEADSNTQRVLNIDAVIFDDGTSEGSRREIRIMNAMRLGNVLETERITNLLARSNTDSRDVDALARRVGSQPRSTDEALASLKDTYDSELPPAVFDGEDAGARRHAFAVGVATARGEATHNLNEITRLSADPRGSMLSLKLAYEEKLKMYRSRGKQLFAKLPLQSLPK